MTLTCHASRSSMSGADTVAFEPVPSFETSAIVQTRDLGEVRPRWQTNPSCPDGVYMCAECDSSREHQRHLDREPLKPG